MKSTVNKISRREVAVRSQALSDRGLKLLSKIVNIYSEPL